MKRTQLLRSDSSSPTETFSSGFVIDAASAYEVTLTSSPAVGKATFQIKRSAGGSDGAPKIEVVSAPFARKSSTKQQVFGYVLVPWLEDSYGDIVDPKCAELAAHSYLRNLAFNEAQGQGCGLEHKRFGGYGYPIESVFDRTGELGGIPEAWWLGMQVTDPETWGKIDRGEIVGFSIGGVADFIYLKGESALAEILDGIPDFSTSKASPTKPAFGKSGGVRKAVDGYPVSSSSYADPANYKYPINTYIRALAVIRYLVKCNSDLDYTRDEQLFLYQRSVSALVRFGEEGSVPKDVLRKVGLQQESLIKSVFRLIGFGKDDDNLKLTEEENDMTAEQVQALINESLTKSREDTTKEITEAIAKATADILKSATDSTTAAIEKSEATSKQAFDELKKTSVDTLSAVQKSITDQSGAITGAMDELKKSVATISEELKKATEANGATDSKVEALTKSLEGGVGRQTGTLHKGSTSTATSEGAAVWGSLLRVGNVPARS